MRLFGAVIVNAWIIRYLGPEQNGVMSYAIAFVGMFSPLAVLGMDSIVVRDIVKNPENKDEILGSSFALRLTGAFFALIFASTAIMLIRADDAYTRLLVFILAAGMVFQSFDVIDYWFQSQVQSKFTVYAKNAAFFIASGIKITAILFQASIVTFVVITSLELILSAFGLVMMYRSRGNQIWNWRFTIQRSKSLIINSWPIVISDLAVFMQSRIDQVMIGQYLTITDVGFYAAAQKISEPLSFIPMVIMSSVFPVIVQTKEWSEEEYYRRLTNLYRIMFIVSMMICIPISLFSGIITDILYGPEYAPSAHLLALLIWIRFYAFYGVARSIFISTENLFRHALVCSIAGVTVNVVANFILIQVYGIYGSIIATHLSLFVTIFLVDAISKKTRLNFIAMVQGILSFYKFKISR